jgi:hypothetical protein
VFHNSVIHTLNGGIIVLTIKRDNSDFPKSAFIQTPPGDPLAIRLRARSVETLDPTLGTEGVLSLVGVESIAGQGIHTLNREDAR